MRLLSLLLIMTAVNTVATAQKLTLGLGEGHTSSITKLEIDPDGDYFVTAAYDHFDKIDNTVKLWDRTGRLIYTFNMNEKIEGIQFDRTSNIVMAYSRLELKLWNVKTGEMLLQLNEKKTILDAQYYPSKNIIITGGLESKMWSSINGKLIRTFEGSSPIYLPDKNILVTNGKHSKNKYSKLVFNSTNGQLINSTESSDAFYVILEDKYLVSANITKLDVTDLSNFSVKSIDVQDTIKYFWNIPRGSEKFTISYKNGTNKLLNLNTKQLQESINGYDLRLETDSSKYYVNTLEKIVEYWKSEKLVSRFSYESYSNTPAKSQLDLINSRKELWHWHDDTIKIYHPETLQEKETIYLGSFGSSSNFMSDAKYIKQTKGLRTSIWNSENGQSYNGDFFEKLGEVSGQDYRDQDLYKELRKGYIGSPGFLPILSTSQPVVAGNYAYIQFLTMESDSSLNPYNINVEFIKWNILNKSIDSRVNFRMSNFYINKIILNKSGTFAYTYGGMNNTKYIEIWDIRNGIKKISGVGSGQAFFIHDDTLVQVHSTSINKISVRDGAKVASYKIPDGQITSSYHMEGKSTLIFKFSGKEPMEFNVRSWQPVLMSNGSSVKTFKQDDLTIQVADVSLPKDLVLSNYGSGFQLNRYSTGEILIKHIYLRNDPNNWVHITPDGFFDASPEAMKLMYWTKGLEVIEFDQLKDRFWVPGLWERLLSGEPLPTVNSRGLKEIDLYPRIELQHPLNNNGKLGIQLFDQGGGYGAVKILINGKEVSHDARGAEFDHTLDSVTLTYDIKGHPFLKQGEVNVIEVKAYNAEEYVVSRPKKLYLVPDGNKANYEPTLHAIIVGTSDYQGMDLDLNFPAKDAMSFSSALELSAKNLLGISKTNFKVLTTSNEAANWPTKENIKKAYAEMSKVAKPFDVIVLYFAGHGVNHGGNESDFYYLTADAANGNLKDPAIRNTTAISSYELTEWIKEIPALKQVLIFDACHSGQFAEDLLAKRDLRNASEVKALERMKDRTGMYILSGSAADAVSYEASIYGQGLLTYALLFGMKGASLRDGKFIDVVQLFQFAANKVPELAQEIGGIQKPEIRVPLGGESFDIGLLESQDREKITLPNPKPLYVRSSFQNQVTFDDNLQLSELMDEKLKNLAEAKSPIVFVDAAKFTNAYAIRGQYKQKGSKIQLMGNLLKDGVIIKTFNIKGETKEQVLEKLIEFGVLE